jgi:hypothetical protein
MHRNRALALAGAMGAIVLASCEHPPFAPRWDTPFDMPLSTRTIELAGFVPPSPLNVIPAGTTAPDSFPVQQQQVSGALGDALKHIVTDSTRCVSTSAPPLSCDVMRLTLTKTTAVAVADTLFVAYRVAALHAAAPGTIVFPIDLAATATTQTDSVYLTQASVQMLQAAADSSGALYVLLRGRVTNPGPGTVTVTSADSIGVDLSATISVAVSH